MDQMARFQEGLRRLAMIDEGFVEIEARIRVDPAMTSAPDPKTTALLQLAVPTAIGRPAVCLEWGADGALAGGTAEDEVAGVLLTTAPGAGLRSSICRCRDLAAIWWRIALCCSRPRRWAEPTKGGVELSAKASHVVTDVRSASRSQGVQVGRGCDDRDPRARIDAEDAVTLPLAGQPGHGRTASLRRQMVWVAEDRKARWTGAYEVICRDCGDHPYLGYSGISPRLQRIRGPYTLEAGVAAYSEHLGLTASRCRS
jgi:alkylhydroperoxidase/carboxymuconolactone decarboxylase family protein YurZ